MGVFVSRAHGTGQPSGTWLKVSYVALGILAVPIMISWYLTGPALRFFFGEMDLISDAALYAQILALAVPAKLAWSQLAQFFTAQEITKPAFFASPLAVVVNLSCGIYFVFKYGFVACPCVTCVTEYFQFFFLLFVFCVFLKLHRPSTPSVGWWTLRDVTKQKLGQFYSLYLPAALALASDYWRFAVIGGICGSQLSPDDLGVFQAAYRIIYLCMAFTGALGQAVGTKVSFCLGAGRPRTAERDVSLGLAIAFLSLCGLSFLVYCIPTTLGSIFSRDPVILLKFQQARFPLALLVFFVNFAVVLERVPIVAGRSRSVLACAFIGSWAFQVPAVLYFLHRAPSIESLFAGVALGYFFLCLMYASLVASLDFDVISQQIIAETSASSEEEEVLASSSKVAPPPQKPTAAEKTSLLPK